MGSTINVEQHVAASPMKVFDAWLSSDELAKWWWPHIPDTTYSVDPRVGGGYRIQSETAGIGVEGDYLHLEPPRRIVMTWRWLDDGVSSTEERLEVTFSPTADGSRVGVVHELDDTAGDGGDIRQGWTDVLTRLAGLFG